MKKQSTIMKRLISSYTLILGIFTIVLLLLFFSLFNNQASLIHEKQMKEQGDLIAENVIQEGYLDTRNEAELSRHNPMMGRGNHMNGYTNYLSLISKLSTDSIYVVDQEGQDFSSHQMNHMMEQKEPEKLSASGKLVLEYLIENQQATFFEKGFFENNAQIGYGVPLFDDNQEFLGGVIVLSNKENTVIQSFKDFQLLIWSVLIALVVTIIMAILIAKRFVKPIHEMSDFTEKLIQQKYHEDLDIKTKDELAALGMKLVVLSERLSEAQEAQDNKEKNQKLFLSQISHELRTPVMVIKNSLEALEGDFLDEADKASYIKQLLKETDQLNILVNDLLELSRLQSTEFSINKEALHLNYVVEDALRSYRSLLKDTTQQLIFTSELTDEDVFYGDYQRLLQLVKILLDNALKYSPVNTNIEINLTKNQTSYLLEIINDSNYPLKKQELAGFFEAFNRGAFLKDKGHGLGLTIAKQIVKRHNGTIEMEIIMDEKVKVSSYFNQ